LKSLKEKNPALILIDIQNAFQDETYWGGNRNNKNAELVCGSILNKWRENNLPLIHIRHSSTNPDSKLHKTNLGFQFHDEVKPLVDEIIITKNVNSAFIGTPLKQILDSKQISSVVIIGITTNHCVSTTARMAGNYGYETFVISDATATFDRKSLDGEIFPADLIHNTSLANLSEEFATILTSSELFSIL